MQVTKYTNFPDISYPHTPLELYKSVYPRRHRSEAYFSFPITSGGARRMIHLFSNTMSFGEKLSTAIRYNHWFARAVCHELENMTEPEIIFTLPYLGKRKGWYEFDYNLFWFFYISGLPYETATEFYDQINHHPHIHRELFNNLHATLEERKQEYKKMINAFIEFISKKRKILKPMVRMFLMPDHHISLGNSMEKALAAYLEIPIFEIFFNKKHKNYNTSVATNSVWSTITQIDKTFKIPCVEDDRTPYLISLVPYSEL